MIIGGYSMTEMSPTTQSVQGFMCLKSLLFFHSRFWLILDKRNPQMSTL